MAEIFISYARRDWAIAEGLAENLNTLGHRVWIDTGLDPRTPYVHAIAEALSRADAVIVIWTPAAIASEWVRYEAGLGHQQNKLLQLRTQELTVGKVPAPFNDYSVFSDGGVDELGQRIRQVIEASKRAAAPQFEPVLPSNPQPRFVTDRYAPPRATAWLSMALLVGGVSLSPVVPQLATVAIALALAVGATLAAYATFFGVSRFVDRFGRQLLLQALIVGLLAGAFAGAVGGYPYAARMPDGAVASGIAKFDHFVIKYGRVIVISAIVGTALSYLMQATLRYARLRDRNLGPAWSRRNVTGQIVIHCVLALVLACATAVVADRLPVLGRHVERLTFGLVNPIGAGLCRTVTACDWAKDCRNCKVDDITEIDLTLLIAIYLWTMHAYHLRQAGGRIGQIIVSSAALIGVTIGVMLYFQLYPPTANREAILQSPRLIVFVLPWLAMLGAAILAIHSNARALEKVPIVGGDRDAT